MLQLTNLIGFGAGQSAPPQPITSLSFVAETHGHSSNFTYPASIVAGDLLIAFDWAVYPPTAIVPSGFTSLDIEPVSVAEYVVSYKIATGAESGTVAGMNGKLEDKYMLQFRGDNRPTLVTTPGMNAFSATTNPTPQVISASGQPTPLIILGSYRGSSAVNPRNFTPAADAEISIDTGSFLKYKIYNSSPADTTIDMDDEGTNELSSILLLVS